MKPTNEEKKLFKETYSKWMNEGSFLSKLFLKTLEKSLKNDPNIKKSIQQADKSLENARQNIEKTAKGDKEAIKKNIPQDVRKALGFDY